MRTENGAYMLELLYPCAQAARQEKMPVAHLPNAMQRLAHVHGACSTLQAFVSANERTGSILRNEGNGLCQPKGI